MFVNSMPKNEFFRIPETKLLELIRMAIVKNSD